MCIEMLLVVLSTWEQVTINKMSKLCIRCGAPVEQPEIHTYCDQHFNEWFRDISTHGANSEYVKEKWR